MKSNPAIFTPTGTIQTYTVEESGCYRIEAAGAQGGDGGGAGGRGALIGGVFQLARGDRVKLVAGRRGARADAHLPVAARGGDSLVWMGGADLPQPVKLLLSARGGSGGGPAAAATAGPDLGGDENDPPSQDSLASQWTRGTKASTGAEVGRTDRCGYNAGASPVSTPDHQAGDGYVSIVLVEAGAAAGGDSPAESPPAAASVSLKAVAPRPASWLGFLRRREPGDPS